MDSVTFWVQGTPIPTARPRVLRSGRAYMPSRTKKAQEAVSRAVSAVSGGTMLFPEGALEVSILARFAYPASAPKKVRLGPPTWRTKRPDVENLAKTVLDGCNGVVWTDDAQVCKLTIDKQNTSSQESEGFWVSINRLEEPGESTLD